MASRKLRSYYLHLRTGREALRPIEPLPRRGRYLEGGTMPRNLEIDSPASQPKEKISPLAGKPAPKEMLVDVARLEKEYFERHPDLGDSSQLVSFGTSGHRGSPLHGTFTEAHILAISQAICEYRHEQGIDGPLYMGRTRMRCPRRRSEPRSRCLRRTVWRRSFRTGRRYPDACDFPRHSGLQPRAERTSRGWHRDHAVAQSARGWRLQVQPS